MQRPIGTWMGLGILLAGCGSPLPGGLAEAPRMPAPTAVSAPASTPVSAPAEAPIVREVIPASHGTSELDAQATRSVVITFQNPRTSFTSDKIELSTGKTLPADDGMSPEGDLSFFFDGSRFQVIANAGGGADRNLAPAKAGKPTGAFSMAPIPLQEGSEVLLKQDHAVYSVTITGLEAGSMMFLPSGTGTGTGSVTFTYRPHAIRTI